MDLRVGLELLLYLDSIAVRDQSGRFLAVFLFDACQLA